MTTLRAIIADMQHVAHAHDQWTRSPEATASEAATSHVFATQIREWMTALGALPPVAAVDPQVTDTGKTTTRDSSSSSVPSQEWEPCDANHAMGIGSPSVPTFT